MAIRIPSTVFEGFAKWMVRGPWPEYFQEALDDHLHAYCDLHDIDSFEELDAKIGKQWVSTLNDMAFNDFLSQDTKDGNAVDLYLKRRGWNEKKIAKAYMEGIRDSMVSIYEVSDIRPGESFLARDLILENEPIRVLERLGSKSMAPWEHFAFRVVEVRGEKILSGGLLPFDPALTDQLIDKIDEMAVLAEPGIEEMFGEMDHDIGDDEAENVIPVLASMAALKMSSALIAETWMMGTVLDPADAVMPQMANSDGDPVEFMKLHWRFTKGATQDKIRAVLDAQDAMSTASPKAWNWVENTGVSKRPNTPSGETMWSSNLEDGATVLGMVTLKGRMLEAETNSSQRAERLTALIQDLLGDLVSAPIVARQTVEQAMAEHRANGTHSEPINIPPEEEARLRNELLDRHYRDTLDQSIPALGGMTPRDAIKTQAGRSDVVAWLKHLETTTVKLQSSADMPGYDTRWMWQELGLEKFRK